MKIRKATRRDIDVAWQIRKQSIKAQCIEHYPPEVIEPWLNGSLPEGFAAELESNFYVAFEGDEIIGLGAFSYNENKIYAMFVKPEFMGKGVGRQIMAYLEALALENNINTVHLDSTLNAAPFYRSLGYVGDTVIKYNNPRGFVMDCVAMQKELSS
ncbi:GNAT family N-acetyltransferase [Shewanella sp. WXL01]|uniref:GNAT family N-acetyltransferase n=1 Tax=Shewanella sp. WXL01 TaxID=2709721 RepID=UPI00143833C5|nr:GNAT family N-acetyltransferase [Shewanella sp. WXL01]NKF52316.1 GNAT family N-acetyltransferase [Shewanella sp. WXL01]